MMVWSGILSALFIGAGLVLSFCFELPSGPVIVLVAAVVYVVCLLAGTRRTGRLNGTGGN